MNFRAHIFISRQVCLPTQPVPTSLLMGVTALHDYEAFPGLGARSETCDHECPILHIDHVDGREVECVNSSS